MADFLIDISNFGVGLQLLEDSTDAPVGSSRRADNVAITDRGGISPRPGTKVLGAWDSGANGCDGFFNLIKSGSSNEIPIKVSGGAMQYFHPTLFTWNTLKTGYTIGAEFDFTEFSQISNFIDYAYFCNAVESYARWQGLLDATTAALTGSETQLPISTTLLTPIYDSGTATGTVFSGTATSINWGGSSWTTLTDSGQNWTSHQYIGWYLLFTSGPLSGQSFYITDNSSTTILTGGGVVNPGSNPTYSIVGQQTTQLVDTTKSWTTNQWQAAGGITWVIHITSGALAGQISTITSNTANILVFSPAFGSAPLNGVTYEIRQTAYPINGGTIVLGSTQIAYTGIAFDNSLTIAAIGSPVSAGTAVTLGIDQYTGNPRGNRLETYQATQAAHLIIGALSPNQQINQTGTAKIASGAAICISAKGDATDFTYTGAGRTAGQGDYGLIPYGGGNITDITSQESAFYTFKKHYIESISYDSADLPTTTPLKQEFGAVNRVIKGTDDVYFMTPDNQFTSLGRVALKDTLPQTTNIGYVIKRLLNTYDFSKVAGIEYRQRLYIACKDKVGGSFNNKVLVYNKGSKAFEGVWDLNVFLFEFYNNGLYFAESATPNVMQMFSGLNDVRNGVPIAIQASWRSNQIHIVPRRSRFRVKPSQFMIEGINTIGYEGYIRDGSQVTLSLFADFADDTSPSLQFTFGILGKDEGFMQPGLSLGRFLGDNPLGMDPLGSISDPDLNGNRHFKFVTYFPDIYCNYLSLGIDSNQLDCFYEITRIGLGTEEEPMQSGQNILTP